MGLIVHIVDGGRATVSGSDKDTFLKNGTKYSTIESGSIVIHIGLMCNGVAQVVRDIKETIGTNKISRLYFSGHGFPGLQGVGLGDGKDLLDSPMASKELAYSSMWIGAADNSLAVWGQLRSNFVPDGEVILTGCQSGRGEKGKVLVSKMSKILGVPVTAYDGYQLIGGPQVGGSKVGNPDGSVNENKDTGQMAKLGFLDRMVVQGANMWADVKEKYEALKNY